MEKLTLRQFADVIKALVEADMPKEAGFTLNVNFSIIFSSCI